VTVSVIPQRPPKHLRCAPRRYLLDAGTTLWRVHSRAYDATSFNPSGAVHDPFGGGRFDSTDADPYAYYYAGLSDVTALVETFARDLPFNDHGYRLLKRHALKERRISAVPTVAPLYLVDLLDGPALAAVAQDPALIHAEGAAYAQTRAIGRWLRGQAPWAQGLIWPSARDTGRPTLVLFADRHAGAALGPDPSRQIDLDDGPGADWLNATLAPLRIAVRQAPRRR
jgi:hypothetical protein